MKESLEAVRNIHQILIVVCTIVGIFAVSINHSPNKYDFALEEVVKLEIVLKEISDNRIDVILNGLTQGEQINLSNLDSLTSENGRGVKIKNLTIEDIHAVFLRNWEKMDSLEIYDVRSQEFSKNYSTVTFLLTIVRKFPENASPIPYGENPVSTRRIFDPTSSYHMRLKKDGLVDSSFHAASFLPRLRDIWKEVKMCRLDSAKSVLIEKSNEFAMLSQNDVDLSGFRVAGKYMFLVGPFIMFILILYLTRLVKHITIIFVEDDSIVYTFPWLGLFPDKVSQGMVFVSIVVYPLSSALLLTWNTYLTISQAIYWLCTYFVFFFVLSSRLVVKIYDLRSKMFGEPPAVSNSNPTPLHPMNSAQSQENEIDSDELDDLLGSY